MALQHQHRCGVLTGRDPLACGSPRGRGMRLAGRAGRCSATPQPTRGRVLFVSELQWNVEPGCGLPGGGGGSHRRRSVNRVLVGRSGRSQGNGPSTLRLGGSPGSARPFPSRSPAFHRCSAFQPSSDVGPARHRRAAFATGSSRRPHINYTAETAILHTPRPASCRTRAMTRKSGSALPSEGACGHVRRRPGTTEATGLRAGASRSHATEAVGLQAGTSRLHAAEATCW